MPEWMKCNYESVSELDILIVLLEPSWWHGGDTVQGCFLSYIP